MPSFWLLLRTLLYGSLFLALAAWWLPLRVFERHAQWPAAWSWPHYAALLLLVPGLLVLLSSVWQFVVRGRGTPAPFDPPVKFVRRGPYKWVRNPMHLALFALVGAEGLFFESWHVSVYWICLVCASHLLVVLHEEEALRRQFGAMYEDYKREVPRWLPRKPKPPLETFPPFPVRP